jgi:hypothetical protein
MATMEVVTMEKAKCRVFSFLLGFTFIFVVSQVSAAVLPKAQEFVQFSGGAQGWYWVPDSGPAPHVAFLAIQRTSDYLKHASTQELTKRGFAVLGMNSRFKNNETSVNWELIALDVRAGVRYLRSRPGITKVILLGPSGGGPTVSYYQAVAENGLSYCQGGDKLTECSSSQLSGFLPTDKADGIVFLDGHTGYHSNRLQSLNPALQNETNPKNTSRNLDPFEPKNGYNPDGDSHYSASFVKRYTDAQSRRMNELINRALIVRASIEDGTHVPTGDDSVVIYRDYARLADLSTEVRGSTSRPEKLLKNDGTIEDRYVVHTVRVPNPGNKEVDASFPAGGMDLTLTSFLSANAVRSTNSFDGIDWCSSNNSSPCALAHVTVPLLLMAMQGHYFIVDGEENYDHAASSDKDLVYVEGATHGGTPCIPCSDAHGGADYSNVTKNLYDYVQDWTSDRF